jgi:predicted RNA-binding Zn ribbon-like protein
MATVNDQFRKRAGSKPAPDALILPQVFINTAELDKDVDLLQTPAALKEWLMDAELLPASAEVTESDVRQAISVREALRSLTFANNGGPPDPGALDTLNRAARSAQLAARFEPDGSAKLAPLAPGVDGALGRILSIVFDAMSDGRWQRLKACPADDCLWAFYDETKNRSGTWCNMKVCGNRNKARSFRRRHALAEAHALAHSHAPKHS